MPAPGERARAAAVALLVAAVAFLPFLRGTLAGACLYFRDLSLHFFPLRLFALEGLRQGELRLWNPYVHEGVPLTLPALGYPLDALLVLAPSPASLSLLLALHVPLGAVFFLLLARGLGLCREAAAGGALAYALAGFSLSSVNLYVYVQAAAWAPLVVLGLVRALAGGGRRVLALAALAVAVALSTTGVEIVAQAVLAGVLLGWHVRRPAAAAARLLAALGLATALAAPVLVLVGGQVEGSARGRGFPAEVVLAHSVHPFALVQSVVAGLFGNPANLANEWWGENFFPRGFPYVLSLYLGAALLALAATGAASRRPPAVRLLVLAALGLAVALGRWGVIGPLVEAVPALRLFRFPVKAWFTVHLAVALLAALGVQQLVEGRGRRTLAAIAAALGGLLLAAPLLPVLFPGPLRSFAAAFLPPGFAPEARAAVLGFVLRDAATGGALALAVALVALLALRGQLAGARPAWLAVTLVAVDLLRTGAGLNPMVSPGFYEPSPALAERLPALRAGRVYTCPIETSAAYTAGRLARGRDHELWSFGLLAETLSPSFNVPRGVPTALSPDLTMLVPTERTLAPEAGRCADLPRLLPRLREAAVSTVLSLDALDDPDLRPQFVLGGPRADPVAVHAYALADAPPRIALSGPGRVRAVAERAGAIELLVDSDGPATLWVHDALAPGWRVERNGAPAAFEPQGRHRAVAVPAGSSRVLMEYRPPGLAWAAAASALAAVALAALLTPWRPRTALLALLALAPTEAAAQQPGRPASPAPPALRVADIPQARFEPDGPPATARLRRSADLLQLAWSGRGTASEPAGADRSLAPGVAVSELPWPAPEYARFTLRRYAEHVEEGTLSLQLWSGAEWCTPPLDLRPGSRLRLDPLAVGRQPTARLLVRFGGGDAGPAWQATATATRPDTPGARGLDLELPAGRGRLCLRAEGGAIAVGEARVVEPEPPGSDPRPRFVVLTVCDALRGDILGHPQAERLAPSLVALSRRAQRYERAASTGAHTQAALLPLLLGRDLARVDPVRARRFTPAGTPLGLLYGRGNLALSHLAQAARYHTVFLGNNSFLLDAPLFARFSNRGRPDTGTHDTIAALAATLRRYADERVLLVYYLSTPHNYSHAPRRLFERLGCGALAGVAAERCAYDARVAHADEALLALQQGLAHHGLEASTLQVLTADHGEVFGDGRALEAEIFSQWYGLDAGHGGATHWTELHVPLLVAGPGIAPASWPGRVSTLDVVPTLARLLDLPAPLRLDGAPLPLLGGPRAERPATSQGYCSDSVLDGRFQLVWWEAECARRRERGSAAELPHRAELWRDGVLAATDASDPGRVRPLVRGHLEWLAERLPGEAWVVDGSGLGAASLVLTVEGGRVADWGPASGPARLAALGTTLESDGRLRIDFRGDDPGLVYVSTWPKDAPVRFELAGQSAPAPATSFVGPLQLPLAVAGRVVNPAEHAELWRSGVEPPRQPARGPHWRLWRQPYRPESRPGAGPSVTEMDRVLREWGYIR